MDQIALQASLLNLLEIILVYPALALAGALSKFPGCNVSNNLLYLAVVLGLAYAVLENIWVGAGIAGFAYLEVVLVELACISGESLLDASLMGTQPKVLARLMHL
jgi:hypothetical protein